MDSSYELYKNGEFNSHEFFNASFWKKRHEERETNRGHPFAYTSPDKLLEACYDYFDWCSRNPLKEQNWVGKDGDQVVAYKPRVFTVWGLSRHIGVSSSYLRVFRHERERELKDPNVSSEIKDSCKAFLEVLDQIDDIIKEQKYTGAAVGFFKENLIKADLGIGEKLDIKHSGDHENPIQHNHNGEVRWSEMTEEELRKAASGEV